MKYIIIGVMAGSASFILQVMLSPVEVPFVFDALAFAAWWAVFAIALAGLWFTLDVK